MRILYLSCHEILEFDEVKLLRGLGHYVFSPGAYVEPSNRGDHCMRPDLDLNYDPEDRRLWDEIPMGDDHDQKAHIPKSFVERFDVVIVMHIPKWIYGNWDNLKVRPVVWRTIGQSIDARELELRQVRELGMKIVRYSPMEELIPAYLGADALIRFYKDPADYGDWNGQTKKVVTFNQHLKQRGPACNYDLWEEVTGPLPRVLYGPGNEGVRGSGGQLPYDQMLAAMRDHRAYFYVGTHPASYTLNFIESWMTGIPVVAIGPYHGNASYFPGHNLYEVDRLITQGVSGFYSDNPAELRGFIELLLSDDGVADSIGRAGRESAIHYFGKQAIAPQWADFLKTL